MSRYFLTKLAIEGFRGINNRGDPLVLKFKPDAVNSVFAPNGLGKSSIFDALSYAIRGHVPKLDALHSAEQADQYYRNRFHNSGNSLIELTFLADDGTDDVVIRVERAPDGTRTVSSPSGHTDPEGLLASFDGEFALLDQGAFLRFVEDSPLRRGRTFSGLLGLSKLSEFRQVLELISNRRNVTADFDISKLTAEEADAERQASNALARIRQLHRELIGTELPEPLDEDQVLENGAAALATVDLVRDSFENTSLDQVDFGAVRKAIREAEQGDIRDRLSQLLQNRRSLEKLSPGEDENTEVESLKELVSAKESALTMTSGAKLGNLYQVALGVLESEEWDSPQSCPVCDSMLDQPLGPNIEDKIRRYEAVDTAKSQIRSSWKSFAVVGRVRELERIPQLGISEAGRIMSGLDTLIRNGDIATKNIEAFEARLNNLNELRSGKLQELENESLKLEAALPPSLVELTRQVERASELRQQVSEHRQHAQRRDYAKRKLAVRKRWQEFTKDAKEVFSEAEVSFSTLKTTSIEAEYRTMYGAITNNPEVVPKLQRAAVD